MRSLKTRAICEDCRVQRGLDYGYKDSEVEQPCWLCHRTRYCRLSDLRRRRRPGMAGTCPTCDRDYPPGTYLNWSCR